MRTQLLFIASMLLATTASAQLIVEANDYDEFKTKFCAADHSEEHIFVFPAAIYKDHKTIECAGGTFGLRSTEPEEDAGHMVLNIDPPHGVDSALDCDGKADIGMAVIALNCYPVSKETATHPKS